MLENIDEFLPCRPYVGIWALVVGRVFTRDLNIVWIFLHFHSNVRIFTQWVLYPPMGINRYTVSKYNNIANILQLTQIVRLT